MDYLHTLSASNQFTLNSESSFILDCAHDQEHPPNLNMNISECATSETNSLICSHCNRSFGTPKKLDLHKRRMRLVDPFQCFVCKIELTNNWDFECHKKSHISKNWHFYKFIVYLIIFPRWFSTPMWNLWKNVSSTEQFETAQKLS